MYRNPPFNFVCRTCRPYAYFRTYENLRAHFRAVHRLRQLPPAANNYYIAPLGLNGPDGPISGRNLLHDASSNGASTSDDTRQFQSLNDEPIPGTSHDIGGHRQVHVQLPISGDQLQQAIAKAVKASLNEEIEKRLPLLAAEINNKIAAAMDNKLPVMVSDILMEAANKIEANTVETGTETNPVVMEPEAKPSTSSTIDEDMDTCASTDQKRDEDGTEFNPELMQSTAISIENVNCVVEANAGIDLATENVSDAPIQSQDDGMGEILISDGAGTDHNPENSMNNESLSTQSKRLCEEADALIKKVCATDDMPKKNDDHTESDEELMAVVEPFVGANDGSELVETQLVAGERKYLVYCGTNINENHKNFVFHSSNMMDCLSFLINY